VYTEAYPMPAKEAAMLLDNLAMLNGRNYLAYVEDAEYPVSVANMFYMADKPIVALQGAATLPDYRGHGIYTSLMAKRLQDAHADGIEVAILQGDMETSAPICIKLGFQKACDMAIYVWSQEEREEH
jgi:predicted acetyltransferase